MFAGDGVVGLRLSALLFNKNLVSNLHQLAEQLCLMQKAMDDATVVCQDCFVSWVSGTRRSLSKVVQLMLEERALNHY